MVSFRRFFHNNANIPVAPVNNDFLKPSKSFRCSCDPDRARSSLAAQEEEKGEFKIIFILSRLKNNGGDSSCLPDHKMPSTLLRAFHVFSLPIKIFP